jgi:hypothetical protein
MIKFENTFPAKLTNITGSTVCGITAGNFIELGIDHMNDTQTFYNSYAELAYNYILDGSLVARDLSNSIISPHVAGTSFLNSRSEVQSYISGSTYYITTDNAHIGYQGGVGAQGSIGTQGNQGHQGNQGAIGVGTQGNQGNQGLTGPIANVVADGINTVTSIEVVATAPTSGFVAGRLYFVLA